MSDKEFFRLHAVVEGRVQGVGFRYYVLDMAESLGVTGWVRNRWDDTVEVVSEGERPVLEKLLSALQRGPRAAYVSNVKIDWEPATHEFSSFRVRATE